MSRFIHRRDDRAMVPSPGPTALDQAPNERTLRIIEESPSAKEKSGQRKVVRP